MYDSSASAGKKASLLNFLLTILLVVAGSLYLVLAAYSRDLLWFWPKFSAQPMQIILSCYGQKSIVEGTSEEALALRTLVNGQISGKKRFDPLNLTESTQAYYRNDPGVVTMEVVYSEPIRIHLPNMFFTNITSILIPLDGRYAHSAIVFGLIDGIPAGGSLHVGSNQPIIDYLTRAGLCFKP